MVQSKSISFDDFEQYIYSDAYLKALDKFDYNYHGAIYRDSWNICRFNPNENKRIFFQAFLDKDITNMQYFEAENKTMTFLKQFLYSGLNCVAFYDFNSDSL